MFNQFNDIPHRPLRIYNRSVMFYNIYEDQGRTPAEDYANSFTSAERLEMAQMTALVKKRGPAFVKKLVTEGLDFVDGPYQEAVA